MATCWEHSGAFYSFAPPPSGIVVMVGFTRPETPDAFPSSNGCLEHSLGDSSVRPQNSEVVSCCLFFVPFRPHPRGWGSCKFAMCTQSLPQGIPLLR